MKLVALLVATFTLTQSSALEDVIGRMDAYLSSYEARLSELVADETMIQEVTGKPPLSSVPPDIAPFGQNALRRRRLTSEVAFIALPNDSGWLGFRQVKSVNAKPLEAEGSLTGALRTSKYDAARTMVEASAQYNLGLPRTTNLPNLPLEFLHRRNRHRLLARLDGTERVQGVTAAKVVFLERMTPTLIRNPNGGNMPSVIRAWLDPRDGRLLRAEVNTFAQPGAPTAENSVRVEFERNKALDLLVPIEMREIFPGPGNGKSVATYANYRRFQTSARIVQ